MSAPPKPRSAAPPNPANVGTAPTQTNRQLVVRMCRLAWQWRGQVLRCVFLQLILLALALSGLGLLGLGIDVIGHAFDPISEANPEGNKPPNWPFGLAPPDDWSSMSKVAVVGGLIFVVAAARFFLDRTSNIWIALLVQDIVVKLRTDVYDKLQRLSFRFFDANESGSIINRVTGDVQAVRMFVDQVLIQVLMMAVSLTFFTAYMFSLHVPLTLACLASTPLLWLLTGYFGRVVKPAYRKNRENFDQAIRIVSENAQGVHVVKGFARQQEEIDKFADANTKIVDLASWIFWRVSIFVPLIGFIPQLNLVILMVYGGWIYIQDPNFTIGTLVVFSGLLQQFSGQVGNIAQLTNSVQMSLTGAGRVFEVLDAPLDVQSPAVPTRNDRPRGDLKFEDVGFGYEDGTEALSDIAFDVEAGQVVAILGATGAGKSTLMSLIPRFYDPTRGRILLDGIDLREYELDGLRRSIGLVFQESFLFSNTVAENIAFGHPDATQEQIERAARIACAHDFITQDLEHGYDTLLTEGGSNLSGGQRQRLAIARAVLLDPPVLLMDDPTAAIDPETEAEILEAMGEAMKNRTTFVVAHRLSTLRRADLVLVLEKGKLVEVGTHQELMGTGGHYRDAADMQSADDESRRLLGMSDATRPTEGGEA
ncbi:MAG: ABC transporter ATP-binding protein [Planctomycetota bacterium]